MGIDTHLRREYRCDFPGCGFYLDSDVDPLAHEGFVCVSVDAGEYSAAAGGSVVHRVVLCRPHGELLDAALTTFGFQRQRR